MTALDAWAMVAGGIWDLNLMSGIGDLDLDLMGGFTLTTSCALSSPVE